jgi:hypothetical protein
MSLLLADFVAKVGGPLQVRNFRIQWARRLNQCCAAGLFFESMLRVGMRKIFLQQYRHLADKRTQPSNGCYWGHSGQSWSLACVGYDANDPQRALALINVRSGLFDLYQSPSGCEALSFKTFDK